MFMAISNWYRELHTYLGSYSVYSSHVKYVPIKYVQWLSSNILVIENPLFYKNALK